MDLNQLLEQKQLLENQIEMAKAQLYRLDGAFQIITFLIDKNTPSPTEQPASTDTV